MAALAVAHEHPALAGAQVLEAQPEHLAAAQPAEHHGLDHGPVPPAAQRRDQGVDLGRVEDLRQRAGRADQGHERALAFSRSPRGQPPGTGFDSHSPIITR